MAGKSEQVNLDLTATDKASKVVDHLADQVDDLEKHPAELDVTADTTKATRTLDDLEGTAKRVAQQKWIVDFKADIDKAKDDAARLEGQLKQTGEAGETAAKKVDSIGGEQRVSAIRDLTGPLGDVSSNVGDFGDSFTSAAMQIETSMGLAEGSLTNFLGPIGIAAGAVFTFWTMYKAKAEEAKKATIDTAKSITELGATAAAEKKISELLEADPDLVTNVQALGLGYRDLVKLVSGQAVPAYDLLTKANDVLTAAAAATPYGTHGASIYKAAIQDQAKALGLTEDQMRDLIPVLEDVTSTVGGQVDQFAKSRDIADRLADVMGRRLTPEMADVGVAADTSKQSLHDVQLELHGIDGTHAKADVNVTDNGTAAATAAKVDKAAEDRTAVVHISPDFGNFEARLAQATRNATVTNVTIRAPAGMRASELVTAGDRYARRNGGRASRARR